MGWCGGGSLLGVVLGVLGRVLPAGSDLLEGILVVEGGLLGLDLGKLGLHELVVGGQLLGTTAGRLFHGLFLGHLWMCMCVSVFEKGRGGGKRERASVWAGRGGGR
jgi:hypothetical protein